MVYEYQKSSVSIVKDYVISRLLEDRGEFRIVDESRYWFADDKALMTAKKKGVAYLRISEIYHMLTQNPYMNHTTGHCTVRIVVPEMLPKVAVMVVVPAVIAVPRPLVLMVATDVLDELQVTDPVILPVVPSENVPVAVNCWVVPTDDRVGLAGVTVMEFTAAEVTVRVVFPEIVPKVAVMVVVPAAMDVARPLLLMVTVEVLDELQVTDPVTLPLVPSENVPVAVNCWVAPTGMVERAGVKDSEDRVAAVTVRIVVPAIVPEVAVMVVVPATMVVTRPVPLMVATDVLDELQVTDDVILLVVPLE